VHLNNVTCIIATRDIKIKIPIKKNKKGMSYWLEHSKTKELIIAGSGFGQGL
jgi:hypothetical protein